MPQTAPNLHVSQHPAVLHKLAILRDEKTEPKKFREVVRELSWLLGYEALADVRVKPLEIRTPLETMTAHELGERVGSAIWDGIAPPETGSERMIPRFILHHFASICFTLNHFAAWFAIFSGETF